MTEENEDILNIDIKIKEKFDEDLKTIPVMTKKVKELTLTLNSTNLNNRLSEKITENINLLNVKIENIQSMHEYNFYIAETAEYIEIYKNILKTPMKVSFVNDKKIKNKEKDNIINLYIQKAKKYTTCNIDNLITGSKTTKIVCNNCGNKKQFDIIDECIYVCINCGSQQEILLHTSSYKDIDRVNISSKYTYDRKVHFRDCMNQYQGKQNSTIDLKIYTDLEDQFKKHHLLCKGNAKEKKFRKINKEHIHLFLKELEYTKHYENINLIYYNMTGNKPDDISHLEDDLLNDFDLLTYSYDNKFKNKKGFNRKNFINTQYVLYQLLIKYKHPCKKDDFTILKTVDRKSFHDTITQDLFSDLGWSFTPLF